MSKINIPSLAYVLPIFPPQLTPWTGKLKSPSAHQVSPRQEFFVTCQLVEPPQ